MATRDGAIGIFDSGVGGLTVVHAILEALPHEDLIYMGDTARYPYGTKSAETVTRYGIENVDFLAARAIKMLVVACNTASAVALPALAARYPFPIVGVIDPGARAAATRTRSGKVGVIATDASSSRAPARCWCRSPRKAGSTARFRAPCARRTSRRCAGAGSTRWSSAARTTRY